MIQDLKFSTLLYDSLRLYVELLFPYTEFCGGNAGFNIQDPTYSGDFLRFDDFVF
jgi:hypothetical protein